MKKSTKRNLILLSGGVLAPVVIIGCTGYALYKLTIPRPKKENRALAATSAVKKNLDDYQTDFDRSLLWAKEQHFEEVATFSHDGLKLHGYFLSSGTTPSKVVIIHHGYTGQAFDPLNLIHAKFFHNLGYEVFLPDLRGHGESEGGYAGFGVLDRFDTLSWVNLVDNLLGNLPIVLHGTSMGAATVLMSLGFPEIQSRVSAVIADCGFTSPEELLSDVMKKNYHLPVTKPVTAVGSVFSKARANYKMNDYSTFEALKDNEVPVLYIHGKEDELVPPEMSQKNYECDPCKNKRLLLVDNASHATSVLVNQELYERTETEFLDKVFKNQEKVKAESAETEITKNI